MMQHKGSTIHGRKKEPTPDAFDAFDAFEAWNTNATNPSHRIDEANMNYCMAGEIGTR